VDPQELRSGTLTGSTLALETMSSRVEAEGEATEPAPPPLPPGVNLEDVIAGEAGNDQIDAGGGSDSIDGREGADILLGGEGVFDTLFGGGGNDRLHAGPGHADDVPSLAAAMGTTVSTEVRAVIRSEAMTATIYWMPLMACSATTT
jgi:RTX calcium-binding nonapeptide repeat (4 copies)